MRVVLSTKAEGDLQTIGDYIALGNRVRALSFIRELRSFIRRIGENPLAYPEQTHPMSDLRRAVFGGYLVFYTVTDEVRIERILHSSRDTWLGLPDT